MVVAPTLPIGLLVNASTSNLAYNIPNYLCTNFGAFIKKCTIDQLNCFTITSLTVLLLSRNKEYNQKIICKYNQFLRT